MGSAVDVLGRRAFVIVLVGLALTALRARRAVLKADMNMPAVVTEIAAIARTVMQHSMAARHLGEDQEQQQDCAKTLHFERHLRIARGRLLSVIGSGAAEWRGNE